MTRKQKEHPTLPEQIEAVELAAVRAKLPRPATMNEAERRRHGERLEAAAETLRMLEFGRETLR